MILDKRNQDLSKPQKIVPGKKWISSLGFLISIGYLGEFNWMSENTKQLPFLLRKPTVAYEVL